MDLNQATYMNEHLAHEHFVRDKDVHGNQRPFVVNREYPHGILIDGVRGFGYPAGSTREHIEICRNVHYERQRGISIRPRRLTNDCFPNHIAAGEVVSVICSPDQYPHDRARFVRLGSTVPTINTNTKSRGVVPEEHPSTIREDEAWAYDGARNRESDNRAMLAKEEAGTPFLVIYYFGPKARPIVGRKMWVMGYYTVVRHDTYMDGSGHENYVFYFRRLL